MSDQLRFAVIGAGGFARFAVAQFVRRKGARLVAIYDSSPEAAAALHADHPGARIHHSLEGLLGDEAIDLVYIGSPPLLHFEQSLAALRAGKHVICEKPAALKLEHAEQLRRYAGQHKLLFVVNLMQRYNPLYAAVKDLIAGQLLGDFVHGFFENYASDEFLAAEHWFWDDSKSGGIFVEHGVHFFDMFEGWLGNGKVAAAQRLGRQGHPEILDIAQCEVVYPGNAPVHFFHGFNQAKVLDRQEMRLQFERGDITLHEWVPNRLVLNAVCKHADLERFEKFFPTATITTLAEWDGTQQARGRFKPIEFDRKVRLDTGEIRPKSEVYEELLRAMFDDQLDWLSDRARIRTIDDRNAVESLATALDADRMAQLL